jgi:hypothetical protein
VKIIVYAGFDSLPGKRSENRKNGQKSRFGDGLDLSLNAKNHANFRSFFAKRGGHFRAFREPIYTILSAAPARNSDPRVTLR